MPVGYIGGDRVMDIQHRGDAGKESSFDHFDKVNFSFVCAKRLWDDFSFELP